MQQIKTGSDKQVIQTLTTLLTQHTTKQLDISVYFSDIIKHIFTNNLELKKLIYIYLLSISTDQLADQLLLSVNAFLKDTRDEHAMIRSISLRTMSSIGGNIVSQYLPEPILRLLKDNDPFVRKTAIISAVKLYNQNKQLFFDSGVDKAVVNTLLDGNQAVISNTASILIEMQQDDPLHDWQYTQQHTDSVLAAIPQANEFGVIGLLNWLTLNFTPQTEFELSSAVDKAGSRLTSKNSAVCIAAMKLLLKLAEFCDDQTRTPLCIRLSVAINSLLSSESEEICYLAAKTAVDLTAAYQQLIQVDIRAALPHFNERSALKLTKIQLLIQIANEMNSQLIIEELTDLASSDVDRNVVASLIYAIGKIAIKIPQITNFAVQKVVQMVENISDNSNEDMQNEQIDTIEVDASTPATQSTTTYSSIIESSLICIFNILQVYGQEYSGAIIPILQNLRQINKDEAKIALLKIIENFAGNISNTEDILQGLIDDFENLSEDVQLALITASVKVFLCFQTDEYEKLTMEVLKLATGLNQDKNVICTPDVVERAYFYWRLLSMPDGIQIAGQWLFQDHQVDQEKLSGIVDGQSAYERCKEMGRWSSINGKQWIKSDTAKSRALKAQHSSEISNSKLNEQQELASQSGETIGQSSQQMLHTDPDTQVTDNNSGNVVNQQQTQQENAGQLNMSDYVDSTTQNANQQANNQQQESAQQNVDPFADLFN